MTLPQIILNIGSGIILAIFLFNKIKRNKRKKMTQ